MFVSGGGTCSMCILVPSDLTIQAIHITTPCAATLQQPSSPTVAERVVVHSQHVRNAL
jgi:hypothetical protein